MALARGNQINTALFNDTSLRIMWCAHPCAPSVTVVTLAVEECVQPCPIQDAPRPPVPADGHIAPVCKWCELASRSDQRGCRIPNQQGRDQQSGSRVRRIQQEGFRPGSALLRTWPTPDRNSHDPCQNVCRSC